MFQKILFAVTFGFGLSVWANSACLKRVSDNDLLKEISLRLSYSNPTPQEPSSLLVSASCIENGNRVLMMIHNPNTNETREHYEYINDCAETFKQFIGRSQAMKKDFTIAYCESTNDNKIAAYKEMTYSSARKQMVETAHLTLERQTCRSKATLRNRF